MYSSPKIKILACFEMLILLIRKQFLHKIQQHKYTRKHKFIDIDVVQAYLKIVLNLSKTVVYQNLRNK